MLRYWLGLALLGVSRAFPVNTLLINVAGSFVLGAVLAAMPELTPTRMLLGTGFCGGFTTFSTFSAELVLLGESGATARAVGYAAASLGLGLVAVTAGLFVGRAIATR